MMILLVSGMMMVVLKYASISAKHVTDSYVREQAELYLNSVVEKALLDISAYDRSTGTCWSGDTYTEGPNRGKEYIANVSVEKYYLYDENCSNVDYETISTPESHGYVMLNVEVNALVDANISSRIIRRTLQRP